MNALNTVDVGKPLLDLYNDLKSGKRKDWDNLPVFTPESWGKWTSKFVLSADENHAIYGDHISNIEVVPLYEVIEFINWLSVPNVFDVSR